MSLANIEAISLLHNLYHKDKFKPFGMQIGSIFSLKKKGGMSYLLNVFICGTVIIIADEGRLVKEGCPSQRAGSDIM